MATAHTTASVVRARFCGRAESSLHDRYEEYLIRGLARTFRSQDYSVMSFDGYFGAEPEVQMKQINGITNIKGVEQACQFYTFWNPTIIETGDKELTTENILHTNTPAKFFDFFGWQFLYGSVDGFRQNLNTAVLTASETERLFGPD